MGREDRRRQQRQQQRRTSGKISPPPPAGGSQSDAVIAQAVLGHLARQKAAPKPGALAQPGAAAPEPPNGQPSGTAPTGRVPGPSGTVTTASALATTSVGCDAVEGVDPQALGLSYTFAAGEGGEPQPMTIRFDGRRDTAPGEPHAEDQFSVLETIDHVVPGSGRITVTARVENLTAGHWVISAAPIRDPGRASRSMPAPAQTTGATGFAPVIRVRAPGVRIGAWPALVGTGAGVAFIVQALLGARFALPTTPVLVLSVLACLIGLVGAKVYYMVEHPQRRRGLMMAAAGMCIQGFVLAAVAAVVIGALLLGLPVGRLLDVTTPGLLFGMSIGRVGCFFGGCCAGRPTGSRWGLWSSDRRLGARRIPTQLFESSLALLLGVTALLVMVSTTPNPGGVVFVAGVAAYTLGRQLLFPLRNLPRHTTHGRTLTMAACGLILITAIVVGVLA